MPPFMPQKTTCSAQGQNLSEVRLACWIRPKSEFDMTPMNIVWSKAKTSQIGISSKRA